MRRWPVNESPKKYLRIDQKVTLSELLSTLNWAPFIRIFLVKLSRPDAVLVHSEEDIGDLVLSDKLQVLIVPGPLETQIIGRLMQMQK